MQKTLERNMRKTVTYEKKPRIAARGRSQTTAREGCKNILKISTNASVSVKIL